MTDYIVFFTFNFFFLFTVFSGLEFYRLYFLVSLLTTKSPIIYIS